tara:strand:- start:728 stop:2293 length:1566 start_codon:yes stop_codon:yes gene_type:complete
MSYIATKPQTTKDIENNLINAENKLNSISPTACLAKWLHVSLHLTNGRTHSCYHPPTHKIDINELANNPSALHNTKQKKKERKEMLQGKKPEGCAYCWRAEELGARSDRIYRSSEHWANQYFDIIHQDNPNPTYVEVNFNQACNLKCSYCSPHLSTTWEKEIKEFGPYKMSGVDTDHNDLEYLDMPLKVPNDKNPYVNAFWKWWPELYKNLHVFRITGGEPLMDKNTYKVLDYIAKHPKNDLELGITSNFCPDDRSLFVKFLIAVKKVQDVVQKIELVNFKDKKFIINKSVVTDNLLHRFNCKNYPNINEIDITPDMQRYFVTDNKACKHLLLYVSCDNWGERAEYCRHGLNFEQMHNNIKTFLYETHFTSICFINTFNVFSVIGIKDFLNGVLELRKFVNSMKNIPSKNSTYNNYWERRRVNFDVPLLTYPAWQNINILTPKYQSYLQEAIKFMQTNHVSKLGDLLGFADFEIDKIKRNLEYMQQNNSQSLEDFKLFFNEHDRRRNVNLLDYFPEYDELL